MVSRSENNTLTLSERKKRIKHNMALDFGFHNLAWFKYAGEKVYDLLYPLRAKEILLDKEILELQGKVDVKIAEKKNLHLRAILEARRVGLTKEEIDNAVMTEIDERQKMIQVPSSKMYMPGRDLGGGSSVRSTQPFGSGVDKRDMASLARSAVEEIEGFAYRRDKVRSTDLSTSSSTSSSSSALPTPSSPATSPSYTSSTATKNNKSLLGKVLRSPSSPSVVPSILGSSVRKEEVKKNKNDPRQE